MAQGELTGLGHGVYAPSELAIGMRDPAWELVLRSVSALITAAPGSVASHYTAAQLHGLDLLGPPPRLLAVTRPPGGGSRSGKRGLHVHVARLPPSHVSCRLTVPVTTVARTVIDMARSSDFDAGVVVTDSALHLRLTSKKELSQVLAECDHIAGTRRAADVIEFADSRSESVLESIGRVVFKECGLPPPDLQVEIADEEFVARVDFLWPMYRTIAEVDGAMKYDDRSRAMAQLRRDARLRAAGYEVVHFNWQEITKTPQAVAAAIRVAFQRGRQDSGVASPIA